MDSPQEPLEDLKEYLLNLKTNLENIAENTNSSEYVQPVINSLSESIEQIDERGNAPRQFRKKRQQEGEGDWNNEA
jgi:hypothetical protein